MNDRDQARAALIREASEPLGYNAAHILDAVLAHPDLVLRVLGMTPVSYGIERRRAWVEPPSDSGAET